MKVLDALIIGGGPAGLAAGLHLARAGYSAQLVERRRYGGQACSIRRLENYPGCPPIGGKELMKSWLAQARGWGLKTLLAEVTGISKMRGGLFAVRLKGRGKLKARTVLWCGGAAFRRLGIPGEEKLKTWNTADEAPRLKGRIAAVIGGGEAAVQQAVAMAARAKKVYLVSRGTGLKAHRLLLERLKRSGVYWWPGLEASELTAEGLILRDAEDGFPVRLKADEVFVLIGKEPRRPPAAWKRAPEGFFTAGDAKGGIYRQVAVASGDGIRSAMKVIRYLEGA